LSFILVTQRDHKRLVARGREHGGKIRWLRAGAGHLQKVWVFHGVCGQQKSARVRKRLGIGGMAFERI